MINHYELIIIIKIEILTVISLHKEMAQNKFKIGDRIKRVGGQDLSDGIGPAEGVGMIGEIRHIIPHENGINMYYFIHFPDLYKGTEHSNVLLCVTEIDLELCE
jgi:hypothetical protein